MRTWTRHHRAVGPLIIAVVVAGGVVLASLSAVLAPEQSPWITVGTSTGAAVACCFAAVRTTLRMRLAWLMLGLFVLLFAAGNALWIVYAEAPGSTPILSLADAMYLVALLPGVVGLAIYPVLRGVAGRWRPLVLDALVLVLAVFSLSQTVALGEVFVDAGTGTEAVMLTLYPVTDILLMSLAVVVLLRSVGPPRTDVVLIALAFAIYLVTDSGFAVMAVRGQDAVGTWVELGYLVAPLPLAGAALVVALTPTPTRVARLNLSGLAAPLLPDLTALLALGLIFALVPEDNVSRVIAVALLLAVGLRQLAQTASGRNLRIRLEERLAQRGRELTDLAEQHRQLEAAKYEFITSVSHELRTPLTAIRGSLEMLHDGDAGQLPPNARSVVDIATRGSVRLSRLVDDIIDVERLANRSFGMSVEHVELRQLVRETVSSLAPLADERGVRLVVTPGRASVSCDADRIVQVLVNLLGNALRYAPPGTDITTGIEAHGEHAVVSVVDAGCGIPAGQLEAVFGRFHQVNPRDDHHQGGTGLGLAICKGIVEAHGGKIWVESGTSGAAFRFTLPLAELGAGAEVLA